MDSTIQTCMIWLIVSVAVGIGIFAWCVTEAIRLSLAEHGCRIGVTAVRMFRLFCMAGILYVTLLSLL